MATSNLPIERKRGDTRRIVFRVKDDSGVVIDISTWTNFLLTVDPAPNPTDDTSKVLQINGVIVDGAAGRVGFTPDGLASDGVYFYDAQALDANTEKVTFAEGQYTLTQDITKD